LTSGDRAIRKTYIRKLDYNIPVPYELLDSVACKHWETGESYNTENPIRKDNDLPFQTAMVSLLQELQSRDQRTSCLRLNLGIRGRRQGPAPEPHTRHLEIAGDHRWDYRDGRRSSIPPYRARFLKDMLDLPSISCIEKLSFLNNEPSWNDHHQIWTGAVRTIIQCCTIIVELEPDLGEFVRSDHLEYIQAGREGELCPLYCELPFTHSYIALCSLIGSIPRSLRVLLYQGHPDFPWKPAISPVNVIPSGVDGVNSNLRDLSVHLQQLRLVNTAIAYDFLFPLDGKGQPETGSLHLNWPYLETLELEFVPPWLPSEDQADLDEYENESGNWDDVICDVEAGWGDLELRTEEHFHRLLISLGYATQRMPRLKNMKIHVESHHSFTVFLQRKADQITLEWECYPLYRPDSRWQRRGGSSWMM
ncbi:hypothetical protein N7447_003972, partial [Penicillium robsamsonii]|uniref:uncharacterized protein n=1 Tax=Penicillium robsamsonii TaxID=1792511 RepID=UPI0025499BD8